MSDAITKFPLAWPRGYARTPAAQRKRAHFGFRARGVSVNEAVGRIHGALDAFTRTGQNYRTIPEDSIISTNLELRLDGLPKSVQAAPVDPGAAVYFELDGRTIVLCCDKWTTVNDNLAAIAATLDAMRSLERWGVSESERAFTGFAALPAPGQVQARTCWVVLGIAPTRDAAVINAAWREKAKVCHPDMPGGSHAAMAEVNTARDQALNFSN